MLEHKTLQNPKIYRYNVFTCNIFKLSEAVERTLFRFSKLESVIFAMIFQFCVREEHLTFRVFTIFGTTSLVFYLLLNVPY